MNNQNEMTKATALIEKECNDLGKPFYSISTGKEGGVMIPFISRDKDGKGVKFGGVAQVPTVEEALTINADTVNEWYVSKVLAKIKANIDNFNVSYDYPALFSSQRGGEVSPESKALNAFIKAVTQRIKQSKGEPANYLTADIIRNALYSADSARTTYVFDVENLLTSCNKIGESINWTVDGVDFSAEYSKLIENRETNTVNRIVKGSIDVSQIDCEF